MSDREKAIEYLEPISHHPTITGDYCKHLKTALAALRAEEERTKGCEYTLYNPADEGYHEGLYYRCSCGADYIDPKQAQEWEFCPHCSKSIGPKETLLCVDCDNAEYDGDGYWCAKHACWVDDTTCFDGCENFRGRKLDGGGQDARKGVADER